MNQSTTSRLALWRKRWSHLQQVLRALATDLTIVTICVVETTELVRCVWIDFSFTLAIWRVDLGKLLVAPSLHNVFSCWTMLWCTNPIHLLVIFLQPLLIFGQIITWFTLECISPYPDLRLRRMTCALLDLIIAWAHHQRIEIKTISILLTRWYHSFLGHHWVTHFILPLLVSGSKVAQSSLNKVLLLVMGSSVLLNIHLLVVFLHHHLLLLLLN